MTSHIDRLLRDLEQEHDAKQMDQARIPSAAAFVPDIPIDPWWKRLIPRRFRP